MIDITLTGEQVDKVVYEEMKWIASYDPVFNYMEDKEAWKELQEAAQVIIEHYETQ